jgi:hypothetical protein
MLPRLKSPAQGVKVCKKEMKTTINHETKVISVNFDKKSSMPRGREQLTAMKRILAENGLTMMSGYAIYFDYEKTEKQLAAIARKFDTRVADDLDAIYGEPAINSDELHRISRQRQAGSSLRN